MSDQPQPPSSASPGTEPPSTPRASGGAGQPSGTGEPAPDNTTQGNEATGSGQSSGPEGAAAKEGAAADETSGGNATPRSLDAQSGSGAPAGPLLLFGFGPEGPPLHGGSNLGLEQDAFPYLESGLFGAMAPDGPLAGSGPDLPGFGQDFPIPLSDFGLGTGLEPRLPSARQDDDVTDANRDEPAANAYDPLFSEQWYIQNTAGGVDLNVVKAWDDFTGEGVRVAVCDDGVDYNHPDLQLNYLTGEGYNANTGIADGYPTPGENHGTAVAGYIAAARNGYGIQGVAYDAKIASFTDGGANDDDGGTMLGALLSRQTSFDISQNSWTVAPFQNATGITDGMETLARDGRGGLGTVVVFAGSNERQLEIMSTYYNSNDSPYGMAVGAVDSTGKFAEFSSAGPNLLVTAPGVDVISTDRTPPAGEDPDSYFNTASGTSFSSPMVSGVIALMLEANPDIGYRDVQTILASTAVRTSTMVSDANKPWDWQINGESDWNGGGMHASHDYGFGLVDATAAVRLAESWDNGQHTYANQAEQSVSASPAAAIPDNTGTSCVSLVNVGTDIVVQHAVVTVDITHARFDDLEISLTSPDGTNSVLLYHPNLEGIAREMQLTLEQYMAERTPTFGEGDTWSLMTVTPMGENGHGDWILTVTDTVTGDAGTLNAWTLTLYGDDDTANDYYIYTNEYSDMAADDPSRATLTDDGGTDTINASAVTSGSTINLNPGATSYIDDTAVTIGATTVIENAHTGDGDDVLIGNDVNNSLFGWRGTDNISGGDGNDLLFGGTGDDTLTGGAGSDIFTYGSPDEGGDAITDFSHADDAFHFTYAEFGQSGAGALDENQFFTAASQVDGQEACFYFESDVLWYDPDGADAQAAVQIAHVAGDAVQADDIIFV